MNSKQRHTLRIIIGSLALLMISSASLRAQTPVQPTKVLTLESAVDFALQNYPQVRESLERVSASHAEVGLAKTEYLPRADMLWQGNRATRNNTFGLLLPQSMISPISGPVLPSTSNDSVWGSAAGLLVSWEPFDFGRRSATVNVAQSGEQLANAELSLTRLDVAVAVTNAFFTVEAAEQRVAAAQADVERRQALAKTVHVLVNNDLRPGADASRADAELARAQILLIQAEQADAVGRAVLAELLGIAGTNIQIEPGPLSSEPPKDGPEAPPLSSHPIATTEQARVDEINAEKHVLDRSYFPRFDLQSTIYGRGSGANTDGTIQTGTSGLGLERSNWAAGLTVTFPVSAIFSIREQKQIEEANERAERARYEQTLDDLTGQLQQAEATLNGARLVAEKTPVELQSARDADSQARARYQSGLASIVEVADADGLLVQAETDDALARLAVWNDIALLAAAHGDLHPFLDLLHENSQGGQ